VVAPRRPRPPKYGPKVIAALTFCWAVLGMPALLVSMSAATIDRRRAPERRRKHQRKGRATTKPGSLVKSQIPVRTWADWDDAKPGFVEIDLVAHDGGNAVGEYAFTLTVTDIATKMPFPILGAGLPTWCLCPIGSFVV